MIAETNLDEYLDTIRQDVCSRCVERPPGGPPCAPLGKNCGVEMHLPQLIESIHEVQSNCIGPYLEHNRREICARCAFLHSSICPCPMDYLSVLIVEAVEKVDLRRQQQARVRPPVNLSEEETADLEIIRRTYEQARGTWVGCDWTTTFDKTCLDLKGCLAAEARAIAVRTQDTEAGEDWSAAARWLAQIELATQQAEAHGAAAVDAANAGAWQEALEHSERAWALEFSTGRPIWHRFPFAWAELRRAVVAACMARQQSGNNPSKAP
jgi:hypothetical protein